MRAHIEGDLLTLVAGFNNIQPGRYALLYLDRGSASLARVSMTPEAIAISDELIFVQVTDLARFRSEGIRLVFPECKEG